MFLGEYEFKIDSHHRFIIPSSFRSDSKSYVITYFDKDSLVISPLDKWSPEIFLDQAGRLSKKKQIALLNYIKLNSYMVKMDSQFRIVIPEFLFNKISFSSECTAVGNINYFYIMDREKYLELKNNINREYEEFMNSSNGENFRKKLLPL